MIDRIIRQCVRLGLGIPYSGLFNGFCKDLSSKQAVLAWIDEHNHAIFHLHFDGYRISLEHLRVAAEVFRKRDTNHLPHTMFFLDSQEGNDLLGNPIRREFFDALSNNTPSLQFLHVVLNYTEPRASMDFDCFHSLTHQNLTNLSLYLDGSLLSAPCYEISPPIDFISKAIENLPSLTHLLLWNNGTKHGLGDMEDGNNGNHFSIKSASITVLNVRSLFLDQGVQLALDCPNLCQLTCAARMSYYCHDGTFIYKIKQKLMSGANVDESATVSVSPFIGEDGQYESLPWHEFLEISTGASFDEEFQVQRAN